MKTGKALTRTVVLAMAATLLIGCANDDWKTTDNVEIISETRSPDGRYVATVFLCSGGGAAGYTYANVNLRESSAIFNQRDFLLGKHLWHSFADISTRWKDSETLEVTYRWASDHPDYKIENGQNVPRKGRVEIEYVLEEPD